MANPTRHLVRLSEAAKRESFDRQSRNDGTFNLLENVILFDRFWTGISIGQRAPLSRARLRVRVPSGPHMTFVYFLLLNNGNIYTGLSDDLRRRRISEHRLGKVKSTKNHRPIRFIGYEAYLLKSDALRREKFLKTTEGRRLFRQQYRDLLKLSLGSPSHTTGRPVE